MATTPQTLILLYEEAITSVTSSPDSWQAFLESAGRNYGYRFQDQLLIHHQRPHASAVLTLQQWNQSFGRQVRAGSTGIAVFGRDHASTKLQYYFDLQDTVETEDSRPVPLWTVEEQDIEALLDSMRRTFDTDELELPYAVALAIQKYSSAIVSSNLELITTQSPVPTGVYEKLVENSVSYMVLTRIGHKEFGHFYPSDFEAIEHFKTIESIHLLGEAVSGLGGIFLMEIGSIVRNNRSRDPTFFAQPENIVYDVPANDPSEQTELQGGQDHGDAVQDGEWLPDSRPDPAGGTGSDWEIRHAAGDVPARAESAPVHDPADQRAAEPTPAGDSGDRRYDAGEADGGAAEAIESDGGSESPEPHGVGGPDEQSPAQHRGNDSDGGRVQLIPEEPNEIVEPENAGGSRLPAFLDSALLEATLCNPNDDLKVKKTEIVTYFRSHPADTDRIQFLKDAYPVRFTEMLIGDNRTGYYPTEQGLLLWQGRYPSRTSESVFSWSLVAELTASLIDSGRFLPETPAQSQRMEQNQLSIFDTDLTEDTDSQLTMEPAAMRYPQGVIDDALRIGANERDSALVICAHFMKNQSDAENAQFLREHYRTNGAGFYYEGRPYCIWYDAEGLQLSYGETVRSRMAMTISWLEAAGRIRELLEQGEYQSIETLTNAPQHEIEMLANDLALCARDISQEARDAGYAPTLREAVRVGVFPECKDNVQARLSDPEDLQEVISEWSVLVHDYKDNYSLIRFSGYRPEQLLQRLEDFALPSIFFPAPADYEPLLQLYISGDELDKVLRQGTKEYRIGVNDFFQSHPDRKERQEYLKKCHGEYSGYSGGNDSVTYTRGKGLKFSHGSMVAPSAEVELSWAKVERRISAMVETGRFLEPGDIPVPVEPKPAVPTPEPAPSPPQSRVDEMLRQAELAATLSEETGQNVFFFESGNPAPTNLAPETVAVYPAEETQLPYDVVLQTIPTEPEISVPPQNFRITDQSLGCGSIRQKFQWNVEAIQLLKTLEAENRNATHEEQEVLSRYVGWGGLSQAFDKDNASWSSEYTTLKNLLDESEYASARESTLNAHYTSPTVISAIYKAVQNMGFRTGNILEPSCGVGNFLGLLPPEMSGSRLFGVELDSISGRIAKQLYPEAEIAITGFEQTDRPNFYDLAIGNVPFGQYQVNDPKFNRLGFSIHNYFFAKAIDQVRPGGIVAFVTSRYTLDSQSASARQYMAQRADLLGAIRLPNNAFLANAGTGVVSDILFLQKRESPAVTEPEWVHLGKTEDGLTINQYFIDHPEMVLGQLSTKSNQYGKEECTVLPIPGADLSQQLSEAIQNIHGNFTLVQEVAAETVEDSIPADPATHNFSFSLMEGQVYYRENSRMKAVSLSATAEARVRGLIELRDTLRTLIRMETEDAPEAEILEQQVLLNRQYDSFQQKHGLISSQQNKRAFSEDDSYFLLCSLEILDEDGNLDRKADIFTKRTIRPSVQRTHADTAQEALAMSMGELARVDIPYMAELTGLSPEEVITQLEGQIFQNPETRTDALNGWELAEEYLSGNVRKKLKIAREAAQNDGSFEVNVKALEQVQPKDLSAAEISVRLGSTWIPEEDIQRFLVETLKPMYVAQRYIRVHYSAYTGVWQIDGKSMDGGIYATSTYGTKRMNAYHIVEQTLNLRDVKIYDYVERDGKRTAVLNTKETTIAQGKQAELKQAFQDWIWKDPARRERLTKLYNEKFNNLRPREYDGSHLVFPGMNPEISLRPHQKNAIAHALYGGNTLLAHCVGAGKTFEMVTIAQESKRLGLCHKSMIVVPNHLIGQWASEYLQLYPAANILVASDKDFSPGRRKTFCSRIATGDYDAVIIGHSQFLKIPLSRERQTQMLQDQIDDLVEHIGEEKLRSGNGFTVKQLERSRKSIQKKLAQLNDQSRKDDVVTFEELGIDRIFVDEAHEFKNLAAVTKMQNVAGISQTESQKASDLFMKCRYLDELTGSRGIIFGTGTPISNTMVELYTMQRYLQYNTLEYYGLSHFDAWAANFGETITAIELAPEGTGYRTKTRFARFYNLPELISMFKEIADIQTADMLNLPVPEANYHVEQLEPSPFQKEMVQELSRRADRVRNRMVEPQEDNMLKITSDGRKLALDQRLSNPMLGDFDHSKVSACAENVFSLWEQTTPDKGAQIVFCDLSTPHFDGSFNVYDDLRDKLTLKGIPKEEIRFIHEADSETKKNQLFQAVRSGQVRVLIGSTAKMGTGTNVQTRLAALHDLDAPWRPSDLEQRSGRIIRQGNQFDTVDIFRYVTTGTFDGYSWQIIENKQRFISQIITSKSPSRTMEEVDASTLSYAEIKALTTDNPLIKEKMDLDVEVSRLSLLKSSFYSQKYQLEDQIRQYLPAQIKSEEMMLERYTSDAAQAALKPSTEPGTIPPMTLNGKAYTDKKEAGSIILETCQAKHNTKEEPLGEYCGFSMELCYESFAKEFQIILTRQARYVVSLGTDIQGNIQRIDNAISGIAAKVQQTQARLEVLHQELETAKVEVQKEFPQEQEFQEKSARLQELNSLLNMDQKDPVLLDDDAPGESKSAPELVR